MAKATKRKAPRSYEERHVGSEITDWTGIETEPMTVYNQLRHYNYFYTHKDAKKWVKKWAKDNKKKEVYSALGNVEDWRVSMTVGGLARIMTNGGALSKKDKAFFEKNIKEIIEISKKKKADNKTTKPKKSPADVIKEAASDFIAEVEVIVDSYDPKRHKEGMKFSLYGMMQEKNVVYKVAKATHDYYKPIYDEVNEYIETKCPDLKEGYAHLGVTNAKKYRTFLKKILDESQNYMSGKLSARKPRKKKSKSAASRVAKVNYLETDSDLQITSTNPEKIIGASEVYLFNTRYRTLTKLVSKGGGFDVKGTTVQNIEEAKKKTIRKPKEFFTKFMKAGKVSARRQMKGLKTKEADSTGRIGKDTLIVRVFA